MTKDTYRGFVESEAEELGLRVEQGGGWIKLYHKGTLIVQTRGYYFMNRYMVENHREIKELIATKEGQACTHESLELTCLNKLGVIYWKDPAVDDVWGEETYTDGYYALHGECRDCSQKFNRTELEKMGIEVVTIEYLMSFLEVKEQGETDE